MFRKCFGNSKQNSNFIETITEMKTLFNSYLLQTADAVLQENGIKAERDQLLTLDGMKITALHIYDYSVCFWDTLKKVQELLPFACVQNSYSHKITITAK